MTDDRFLTRSAFAAKCCFSPSYVTKLGHQGRLVLCPNQRLIDVEATLANLNRTVDPSRENVRRHHAAARVEKYVTAFARPDAPGDEGRADVCTDPKYWDNKARREGALAELAEVELERQRNSLVDRARVEATAIAAGLALRDAALRGATQLAPVFATMTDAFQIEIKLRDALRQVFADAAKLTVNDLARLSEQSQR